jgi:hypothetical protein
MPQSRKQLPGAEAITWRKTGDEAVILNLETSEYYSANETGTFIWEQLNSGGKIGRIAAALAEEYGIPKEQAERDTHAFLAELAKLKILGPEALK